MSELPETADAQQAAIPMRRKRKISLKAKIDAAIDERLKAELPGLVERELQRKLAEFEYQFLKKRTRFAEMEASASGFLQLKFTNQPSPKIFTKTKVKAENSGALGLALVDPLTERVFDSGPESSMKVELVLVNGEMEAETGNWTWQYFQDNIVSPRKGRQPLLMGDVNLKLNEGIAEVSNVKITDNSSWLPSRSFKLVARVANGYFNETRIKEAITNAFVVIEGRLKCFEKHYPPHPEDPAWRLERISKNGEYHKRLTIHGIHTVEDVLKSLKESRNGLRDILKMPDNDAFEAIVKHAETCILSGEMVMGSICNQPFNPGRDITEVVNQQSVQNVYEQHVVGSSSNVPITSFSCGTSNPGIPNDDFVNDQQFGGSLLLQQQNVTLRHSGGGTSTSGYLWNDPGLDESPAVEIGAFLNDILNGDMHNGNVFLHELEFPEENHAGSADGCFNMPTDSTARKHKDNLKWSTIIAAMAFSVRIVAVKDMEVKTPDT